MAIHQKMILYIICLISLSLQNSFAKETCTNRQIEVLKNNSVPYPVIDEVCGTNLTRDSQSSVKNLLETVINYAKKGKYADLKDYIFPLTIKNSNIQEEMLHGIEVKKNSGDYCYSEQALNIIITKHLNRFKNPADDKKIHTILKTGFGDTIGKIATDNPNDIALFFYRDVLIVIIKYQAKYQLVFWENMNNILKEK